MYKRASLAGAAALTAVAFTAPVAQAAEPAQTGTTAITRAMPDGELQADGSTRYGQGVSLAEAIKAERARLGKSTAAARSVCYRAHVAGLGWQAVVCNGGTAGTEGQSRAMEALEVAVGGAGEFCVNAHLRNIGWQAEAYCANDGGTVRVGTVGQARPMEAVMIGVSSGAVKGRAHVQNIGWLAPQDDAVITLGTTAQTRNLEAVRIWL
ncbi:hypothetical protein [Streptomyces scabiei]|uniref:hypothetical protein n=1 Tax=Streptomyces scabiei TaxID=1930 RepID=UPI0029B1621C|nr:hypothetical protein [Streptomyces scabiei]MDX3521294.1 hypothetical protein [Streptomyces scabiei]